MSYSDVESELSQAFRKEEVMRERSSCLHYPNNSCINLVLPILKHPFIGSHILLNLGNGGEKERSIK